MKLDISTVDLDLHHALSTYISILFFCKLLLYKIKQ